ncbi:MAG: hypothetical protein JWO82_4082, partial [Akkermansiaceae bacterium]|nr:hypothetical protein [Akkermansiaceae bacterium]
LAPGLLFQISSLARAAYLTIVSSQRTILLLSVSSAVVVTILNLLLVPKFGVEGAAISTTLAILFNCVIANWIFPATRLVANIQLKALFGR